MAACHRLRDEREARNQVQGTSCLYTQTHIYLHNLHISQGPCTAVITRIISGIRKVRASCHTIHLMYVEQNYIIFLVLKVMWLKFWKKCILNCICIIRHILLWLAWRHFSELSSNNIFLPYPETFDRYCEINVNKKDNFRKVPHLFFSGCLLRQARIASCLRYKNKSLATLFGLRHWKWNTSDSSDSTVPLWKGTRSQHWGLNHF